MAVMKRPQGLAVIVYYWASGRGYNTGNMNQPRNPGSRDLSSTFTLDIEAKAKTNANLYARCDGSQPRLKEITRMLYYNIGKTIRCYLAKSGSMADPFSLIRWGVEPSISRHP